MKKFEQIYRQYINEQDQTAAAITAPEGPGAQTNPNASALNSPQSTIDNQQAADGEGTPHSLDSTGFVSLVRLLKAAFIAKPSDADSAKVTADTPEINETNAMQVFKQLLPLIGKYVDTAATTGDNLNLDKIK